MDPKYHFQSLTKELEALKDRVLHFIGHAHAPTTGEWKESVLRSMLAQRLPDTIKVGRGFILKKGDVSKQCDLLLYRSNSPIPFRDGDLVFVSEDAVVAVIEVKSKIHSRSQFCTDLTKFTKFGDFFRERESLPILGFFAYEVGPSVGKWLSEEIPQICNQATLKIDLMSLGHNHFLKWWEYNPEPQATTYNKWHSDYLKDMAAGYFISNIIDLVTGGLVSKNDSIWFPGESKETTGLREVISPTFG